MLARLIFSVFFLFATFSAAIVSGQIVQNIELITNGDFETGDLTGWTVEVGNPQVWNEGEDNIECFGKFFYMSGMQTVGTVSQTVNVVGYASSIDAGNVEIELIAAMGSWLNADIATITATFRGSTGSAIGSPMSITALNNPHLNSGSEGLTALGCWEMDFAFVPVGTRFIEVEITSTRGSGTDNDGHVDNISLILNPTDPEPLKGVEIIAHRGNSSVTPENTIVAINSAFENGADHIEIDIRLTSDGVAVLMHDSTVDRTTNGTGAIANMTLPQAKQLDAGSWKGFAFIGERVPTLAEALVAVGQRGKLYLDVKVSGMGPAIQAALIEASNMDSRTYTSNDIWYWPGPTPDFKYYVDDPQFLGASLPSVSTWQTPGYFDNARARGLIGWDVSAGGGGMTTAFADAARNQGMIASVYTINSTSQMQQFINLGVTAIETDYPNRLADLVLLRGDVDLNGQVDFGDIEPFVDLLLSNGFSNEADANGDGQLDFADIEAFVDLLFN